MEDEDGTSHSFIVKVWLERTRSAVHGPAWRGRITHVPSGERQYVEELDAIALFIAPRLAALGVRLSPVWRFRRWLLDLRRRRRSIQRASYAAGSSSKAFEEDSSWP
jgi:hypothetical protein